MSDRLAQLTKLHEVDPNDAFVTYGIAMEHAKAEQFDDAIEWFDRTLGLDATYCYAYYQKARSLSELGRDDDARAAIDAGLAAAQRANDEKAFNELTELREALG